MPLEQINVEENNLDFTFTCALVNCMLGDENILHVPLSRVAFVLQWTNKSSDFLCVKDVALCLGIYNTNVLRIVSESIALPTKSKIKSTMCVYVNKYTNCK